jgi:hypothetical protein
MQSHGFQIELANSFRRGQCSAELLRVMATQCRGVSGGTLSLSHSEAPYCRYQVDYSCRRTECASNRMQLAPPHETSFRIGIAPRYRRFKLMISRHDNEQRVRPVGE